MRGRTSAEPSAPRRRGTVAKYSQLNRDQKTRYWELFHQTCNTLRFAIIDLKVAAAGADRSSEASAILAENLRLEAELALPESHSFAGGSDSAAISPPSAADVSKVTELAQQVDVMTADAETFRGVIALADQAVQTYDQ